MTACIAEFKAECNYVMRNSHVDCRTKLKGVNPNSSASKTSCSSNAHRASGFSKFFSCVKPLSTRNVVSCLLKILGYGPKQKTLKNSRYGRAKQQSVGHFKTIEERAELKSALVTLDSQPWEPERESRHRKINEIQAEVRRESPPTDAHLESFDARESLGNGTAAHQIHNSQEESQNTVFDNTSDEELVALMTEKMVLFH